MRCIHSIFNVFWILIFKLFIPIEMLQATKRVKSIGINSQLFICDISIIVSISSIICEICVQITDQTFSRLNNSFISLSFRKVSIF